MFDARNRLDHADLHSTFTVFAKIVGEFEPRRLLSLQENLVRHRMFAHANFSSLRNNVRANGHLFAVHGHMTMAAKLTRRVLIGRRKTSSAAGYLDGVEATVVVSVDPLECPSCTPYKEPAEQTSDSQEVALFCVRPANGMNVALVQKIRKNQRQYIAPAGLNPNQMWTRDFCYKAQAD